MKEAAARVAPAGPLGPSETPGIENPAPGGPRRYLRELDLYRVVAALCVVAQHAVLWPVPSGSEVGWSLVMVLHATREAFFFLATLVACYSQLASPRPPMALWRRRIGTILVPYLAWTLVYFGYTLATSTPGHSALSTLGHDLVNGYYQLYFLVVLAQVYLVLPGIVWLVRRTRGYHVLVLGASLVLQLAMTTVSHYFPWHSGAPHELRSVVLTLLTPRLVTCYQLYVVAGALAAAHLGDLQRLVERHTRRIGWAVLATGGAAVADYALGLALGQSPGHASDLFQPVANLWFLAACAGLVVLGWQWARRSAVRAPTRVDRLVTWGSDASGGFYLGHVLVLQLLFSGLSAAGLAARATWGATSAALFAGTVAGTGLLVAVLLRTPLAAVLTGPDRRCQRRSYATYPPSPPSAQSPGSTDRQCGPAARSRRPSPRAVR